MKGKQNGIGSLYNRFDSRVRRWFWIGIVCWVAAAIASPRLIVNAATLIRASQLSLSDTFTFTGGPAVQVINAGTFSNAQMNLYLQSLINGCSPSTEISGNANATQAITGCVAVPAGTVNNNSAGVAGFANSLADSAGRTHGNAVGGYFQGRALANNSAVWGINPLCFDAQGLTGHNITCAEIDVGVSLGSTPAYLRGLTIIASPGIGGVGTPGTNSIGIEMASTPGAFVWNKAIMLNRGISANGIVIDSNGFGGNNNSQSINLIGYDGGNVAHQSSVNGTSTGNVQLQPDVGGAYFALRSGGGFQFPGSTSGASTVLAPATGGGTNTLPQGSGTLLQTGSGAGNLLQTKRIAGCTTSGGATPFTGPCTTTVTWPNTFADGNYTVTCTGNGIGAAVPVLQATTTILGASTVVQTQQATGVNASFTNIECTAIHD